MQPKKSDYNVSGKKYHVSLQSICFILSLIFRLRSLLFSLLPITLFLSLSKSPILLPHLFSRLFNPTWFSLLTCLSHSRTLRPLLSWNLWLTSSSLWFSLSNLVPRPTPPHPPFWSLHQPGHPSFLIPNLIRFWIRKFQFVERRPKTPELFSFSNPGEI